jgi:hypothetical protein
MGNDNLIINGYILSKSEILSLIKQNRKIEAVKLVKERANIGLKEAKDIVEEIQANTPTRSFNSSSSSSRSFNSTNIDELYPSSPDQATNRTVGKGVWINIFIFLGVIGFLFAKYVIGFQHIPHHLETLKNTLGYSDGESAIEDTSAMEAYQMIDTAISSEETTAVASAVSYPFDTTLEVLPEIRKEERRKIKAAHFETLIKSKNSPNDVEARIAIIRFNRGELGKQLIEDNATIKIGQCYNNPNLNGNHACVSAMIFIYDRASKGESTGYSKLILKSAYDFYQESEGDNWEARDLSMAIPFDYALFRKYKRQ